jgi:hypothetical protein
VTVTVRSSRTASRGRAGGQDFSSIVDALCDHAKIERTRVPAGWKPA